MTDRLPTYQPTRRTALGLLGLLILVGAWLRLGGLGDHSLWYDEAATWGQVNGSLADVIERTAADNYPPLYNLLAWSAVQLLGDAEWVLRLPSALLAIATIPLIYGLGTRLGGRTAGLLAALLVTLSGLQIWYAQDARPYALMVFAATAHGWCILELMQRRRWGVAGLAFVSGAALAYAHPFGVLTWIAIGAGAFAVLAWRRDWRGAAALVGVSLAIGLSVLPWALILLDRARHISESGFWIDPVDARRVWSEAHRATNSTLLVLIGSALLLLRRDAVRPPPGSVIVLIGWAALPLLFAIAASLLVEPVLIARYIIASAPALMLLASLGGAGILRRPRGATIAAIVFALVSGIGMLISPSGRHDDWRGAVAYLTEIREPDACIAASEPIEWLAIAYYDRQLPQCRITLADGPAGKRDVPLYLVTSPQSKAAIVDPARAALQQSMRLTDQWKSRSLRVERFEPIE